jgi:hypothetical protein
MRHCHRHLSSWPREDGRARQGDDIVLPWALRRDATARGAW